MAGRTVGGDFIARVDRRRTLTRGGVRRDDATAALRLSRHRTWRPAQGVTAPLLRSPRPACRFARPTGGTVEFLGRDPEQRRARRRLGSQSACLGQRPLADPPYVFGAAGRTSDNRNNRTSRRHQKHRRFATHQDCEVPLKKTSRKRGIISVRALDRRAMICVRRRVPQGRCTISGTRHMLS